MDDTPHTTSSRTQTAPPRRLSSAAACRRRSRRRPHAKKIGADDDQQQAADENAEVEERIAALQKIVPGGERLPVAELFEETADYIFALECQVKALRFLAAFVQTSEKRKRKLGG